MKKDGIKRIELNKRKLAIMPAIPHSIVLNGITIETEYNENLLSDRERFAEFCPRTLKITLASNLSQERAQLSYCHEIVEAIKSIYALDLKETEIQALGLAFRELLMQGKLYRIIETD